MNTAPGSKRRQRFVAGAALEAAVQGNLPWPWTAPGQITLSNGMPETASRSRVLKMPGEAGPSSGTRPQGPGVVRRSAAQRPTHTARRTEPPRLAGLVAIMEAATRSRVLVHCYACLANVDLRNSVRLEGCAKKCSVSRPALAVQVDHRRLDCRVSHPCLHLH